MKRIASQFAVRIIGVILLLFCVWFCMFNVMGIIFLNRHGALFNEGLGLENEILSELLLQDLDALQKVIDLSSNNQDEISATERIRHILSERFRNDNSNFIFSFYDGQGNRLLQNEPVDDHNAWFIITKRIISPFPSKTLTMEFSTEAEANAYEQSIQKSLDPINETLETEWTRTEDGTISLSAQWYPTNHYVIHAAVRDPLTVKDRYFYNVRITQFLVRNQRLIVLLATGFALLSLLLLVFLIIGVSSRTEGPRHRSWVDSIPIELYALLLFLFIFLPNSTLRISAPLQDLYYTDYAAWMLVSAAVVLFRIMMSICLILSFSRRCKCQTVLQNSLIKRVLLLLKKGLSYLGDHIAFLWKVLLILLLFTILEGLSLFFFKKTWLILIWAAIKVVLSLTCIIISVNLNMLENGIKELRGGNLDNTIDSRRMLPMFRRQAANVNGLRESMIKTVDEQMRSERLKTELITNVSHDIKTPITSIINYVDLLKKDGLDSPNAPAYLDVLDRQSVRLKKLVVDLVDASKASTGSFLVIPERVDVNLLLSQAEGEYEDRMAQNNLTMVLNLAAEQVEIFADPKLLWRVFDNLLNNALLYSQPGTRIYIDSSLWKDRLEIQFRNVSSKPLNISPEELMERFVRGDSSRNTEGSGLGLSIARSLTELQGGEFTIQIDGDLFKALLRFPQYRAQEDELAESE